MELNSRGDLFKIELPKVFIPDIIKKNYQPYIDRVYNILYKGIKGP